MSDGEKTLGQVAADAIRQQTIKECAALVAKGIQWHPEAAFSEAYITGANDAARLLSAMLLRLANRKDRTE
jgi:hypothetical protein